MALTHHKQRLMRSLKTTWGVIAGKTITPDAVPDHADALLAAWSLQNQGHVTVKHLGDPWVDLRSLDFGTNALVYGLRHAALAHNIYNPRYRIRLTVKGFLAPTHSIT